MNWLIIVLVLFSVTMAYIFTKRSKKEEMPHVRYVCDICGEKDCICHKEDTETKA